MEASSKFHAANLKRDLPVGQHITVALKKPQPIVNFGDKPVSVASEVSCVATRSKVLASSIQGFANAT